MQEILKETPEVRQDRVRALKERIDRNEYSVDTRQVADRMLSSLLSDLEVDK